MSILPNNSPSERSFKEARVQPVQLELKMTEAVPT